MTILHLSRDSSVDAGYIYMAKINVGEAAGSETHGDDLVLDFDAEGRLLGIETLAVSRHLGPRDPTLRATYRRAAGILDLDFGETATELGRPPEATGSGIMLSFRADGRLLRVEVPDAVHRLRPELLEEVRAEHRVE